MLYFSRKCTARRYSSLSFTVNECIGKAEVGLWATLTMSRESASDPWETAVHQRKTSVFLSPLPDEVVGKSVVAWQFLSRHTMPSSQAIRVLSVNGNPVVSARMVRREMERSNMVVLCLLLRMSYYRAAARTLKELTKTSERKRKRLSNATGMPPSVALETEPESHLSGDLVAADVAATDAQVPPKGAGGGAARRPLHQSKGDVPLPSGLSTPPKSAPKGRRPSKRKGRATAPAHDMSNADTVARRAAGRKMDVSDADVYVSL